MTGLPSEYFSTISSSAFVVLERGHAQVGDVTLVLQDLGDRNLDLGRRGFHRLLANRGRILDADQQVGDGISHAHMSTFECTDIRFRENLFVSWKRARSLHAVGRKPTPTSPFAQGKTREYTPKRARLASGSSGFFAEGKLNAFPSRLRSPRGGP